MIVRAPSRSTRRSANHLTAWLRVRLSSSWPIATSSAGLARMVDAHDVLLDDRPLVEVARDEVRRRADELDAAGVRLTIGFAPLNPGRNEWWMLMQRPGERGAQLGREDLHVAGEHDELDVVLARRRRARAARTPPSPRRRHRVRLERHAIEVDEVAERPWFESTSGISTGSCPARCRNSRSFDAVPGGGGEHEGAQRGPTTSSCHVMPVSLGDGGECGLELVARRPRTRPAVA